jgi:hypothetical protein
LNTPYSNIIKRFERKIQKDKDYFTCNGITDAELLDMINRRSNNLLIDSLDEIQLLIAMKQNIDINNRNDSLGEFNFELTKSEEDLISDLMVVKYFDEELIRLKAIQKYLGDDIKMFSPSAERKTYLEMVEFKHSKFEVKLSNYNSIDRNTGKFLLAY